MPQTPSPHWRLALQTSTSMIGNFDWWWRWQKLHCDNEEMNVQGKGLWWPQGIGNWRVCLTMRGLSGSDISPLPGLMCPSAYCVFHIGAPINSRVGAIVPQYLPIPKPSSHPVWASFPPPPPPSKRSRNRGQNIGGGANNLSTSATQCIIFTAYGEAGRWCMRMQYVWTRREQMHDEWRCRLGPVQAPWWVMGAPILARRGGDAVSVNHWTRHGEMHDGSHIGEEGVTCCELAQAGCVHQRPGCEREMQI